MLQARFLIVNDIIKVCNRSKREGFFNEEKLENDFGIDFSHHRSSV